MDFIDLCRPDIGLSKLCLFLSGQESPANMAPIVSTHVEIGCIAKYITFCLSFIVVNVDVIHPH